MSYSICPSLVGLQGWGCDLGCDLLNVSSTYPSSSHCLPLSLLNSWDVPRFIPPLCFCSFDCCLLECSPLVLTHLSILPVHQDPVQMSLLPMQTSLLLFPPGAQDTLSGPLTAQALCNLCIVLCIHLAIPYKLRASLGLESGSNSTVSGQAWLREKSLRRLDKGRREGRSQVRVDIYGLIICI